MDINHYTDYQNATTAELHEAIFNTKQKMKECIKSKNVKGYLKYLKINIKLNQLLDKEAFGIGKHK